MASPIVANGHPATPPASTPTTQSQPDPQVPLTSLTDSGTDRRPRDARLIHLVLSSLGIHSYQERVPLQLLDFAYRYTSSVLNDSLRLAGDGYSSQTQNERDKRRAGGGENSGEITVNALRQAIASRQGHTFQGALPREFMLEQAAERNRVALPKVERSYGVQLPAEKYCLTGTGWGLREEWDSDEDVADDDLHDGSEEVTKAESSGEDKAMGGMDEADDEDEEGGGSFEDVFGGGGEDEDTGMTEA